MKSLSLKSKLVFSFFILIAFSGIAIFTGYKSIRELDHPGFLLFMAFIPVLGSLFLALFLIRGIVSPIIAMAGAARRIANGDLNVRVEVKSKDEIGLLAGAFNDMAACLNNSFEEQNKLYESEKQKARQMAVLHEAAAAITSGLALDPLMERLATEAASLAGAELSALVVLYPETGAIRHFKTNIPGNTFPVEHLPEGRGLFRVVLMDGISIRLDDVSSDPRFEGFPSGHPFISSLLGIPLSVKNKVIGGLFVANKVNSRPFTREDEDLLIMLGLHAATAVENARLYTETVEMATTDSLTCLTNRRAFMEQLTIEVSRSRRFSHTLSLLIIDIDQFKRINDNYGHSSGDVVLQSLSRILKGQLRLADIVARYGGEEFAVILPETNVSGARLVGEKIRKAVAHNPFLLPGGEKVGLTVSIGITCFPGCAGTIDELIERADQALYAAKRTGRNRVYHYREILIAQLEEDPGLIASLLNKGISNSEVISNAINMKTPFFSDHATKTERYASLLAQALNLSDTDREALRFACLLHDIGIVTISSDILNKPSPLSPEEWVIMKKHPVTGAGIIEKVTGLQHIAPIIRSHHEWYDGSGYPDGLKGEDIQYLSRIIAIAEAYAAMISELPFYRTLPEDEAGRRLKASAGSQFDPLIVEAFYRLELG